MSESDIQEMEDELNRNNKEITRLLKRVYKLEKALRQIENESTEQLIIDSAKRALADG